MPSIILNNKMEAIVDKEDYLFLNRFTWTADKKGKTFYALTSVFLAGKRHNIYMHQLIMLLRGKVVDHANRNGLDNRRLNLRYCDKSQNLANGQTNRPSQYGRGVYRSRSGRFVARLTHKGKIKILGTHNTAEQAQEAFDKAALKYHGEFATLNNPHQKYLGCEEEKKGK